MFLVVVGGWRVPWHACLLNLGPRRVARSLAYLSPKPGPHEGGEVPWHTCVLSLGLSRVARSLAYLSPEPGPQEGGEVPGLPVSWTWAPGGWRGPWPTCLLNLGPRRVARSLAYLSPEPGPQEGGEVPGIPVSWTWAPGGWRDPVPQRRPTARLRRVGTPRLRRTCSLPRRDLLRTWFYTLVEFKKKCQCDIPLKGLVKSITMINDLLTPLPWSLEKYLFTKFSPRKQYYKPTLRTYVQYTHCIHKRWRKMIS